MLDALRATGLILLALGMLGAGDAPPAPATGDTPMLAETPHAHDYFQLRDGLANSRARILAAKAGRVAFLGGSITAMAGWKELVQQDLRTRFPDAAFDFVTAGIPSLGSTPHAFRFERDVLARGPVDLLFVEAAVNDATNGMSEAAMVRGMEGVVRQARRANPAIDIVMLHFAEPASIAMVKARRIPPVVANHERVAARYGIPSIDLVTEVAERIAAGEFTWEQDFRDLHPAPFGHALYARSVSRLFHRAWDGQPAAVATPHPLPAPLDAASYDGGRLVAPAAAGGLDGFRLDPAWKPADTAGTREGFVNVPVLVAERAGAACTLAFTGRGVGVLIASGPDTGMIEFSIDGGAPRTVDGFSAWSRALHLPWAVMLDAELSPGAHTLSLKVAAQANPASSGHALRIVHFLVN